MSDLVDRTVYGPRTVSHEYSDGTRYWFTKVINADAHNVVVLVDVHRPGSAAWKTVKAIEFKGE